MPTNGQTANVSRILLLVGGAILVFLFVWFQWRLLFLGFAGLLFSILLHTIASWVERRTPLNPLLAYLTTLIVLITAVIFIGLLLAPRLITQLSLVASILPKSIGAAKDYLQRSGWGASVLVLIHKAMYSTSTRLAVVANDAVQGVVDLVIILIIGFFGALNPRAYKEGVLSLVPAAQRPRARKLTGEIIATLRSWLLGQFIPMAVLGVASMVGLWLLGVPLAFTIGLLTGVLIFVPYIGSISSGVLAVLLALQRGPRTALYVFLLYCAFHLVEGYLLTPFVQKKAARLPPILTILSQFCLWSFGGILGVAVAAPLAAMMLVVVDHLYLHDRSLEHS